MPTLVRDYDTLLLYNNFGGCSNVCFDDNLGYFSLDNNVTIDCLNVTCNTIVTNDLTIDNNLLVCQNLTVNGNACFVNDLDLNGKKVLFANVYSQECDLPDANTYHGMFAHVHSTGKGYFAHAGSWHKIIDQDSSTTTDLTEGTNLYYTNARSRLALCGTGDITYCDTTGEINVTTYKSSDFDTDFSNKSTTDLTEGNNLYYTDARVRLALCGTGDITYCDTTGEINVTTYKSTDFDTDFSGKFTCDLAECGNLYYTDGRVDARIALNVDDNQKEFVATGEISAGDVVRLNNDGTVSFAGLPSIQLSKVLDNPNAYDTPANDFFGRPVSISESYTIVGVWREGDAGGTFSGKAYIYDNSTGNLLYTLDNPNPYGTSANDNFGHSASISESYAIVGAPYEDELNNSSSGKAYIYDTSTGNLLHTLDNPNDFSTSSGDNFGYSTAISESYAIVTAPGEDEASASTAGKAYIFSTSTGNLLHTLDNPNAFGTSSFDNFGFSVAISESYAILGAYTEDELDNDSSGKAYIFSTSTGNLLHTLDNPNAFGTAADDRFGFSVAISESYAIVGAYTEDEDDGTSSGKAYIYDTSTGNLLHTLDNPNAFGTIQSDIFGISVAISESYAIVGAVNEDDAGGSTSGKAYIFSTSTGNLLSTLDNPNAFGTSQSDQFGFSVAISESYVVVGASSEDDAGGLSSGKAYIYNLTIPSNWLGIAAENIADTATGKIDLPGAINKNQTGLVTNSAYYVSATGTLTSTFTSYRKIGKALSSTELQITDISSHNTDNLTEGTNLYYTDARSRLALCGGTGVTYCDTTGEISIGQDVNTTSNVTFNDVTVCGSLLSDDITASNVFICGDLTVTGTTTTVCSNVVAINDINLTLACNATTPLLADGGGITLNGANACLFYSSTTDTWNLNKNLTANIIGQVSDISNHYTCDLAECINLYYTDARSRLALCGTGDITYCDTTGEISVTTYKSSDFDTDFSGKFTCDLAECGNLYYTDARSRLSLCGTGDITYCNTTGEINVTTYKSNDFDTDFSGKFTCDLAECGNLYYTDARVDTRFNNSSIGSLCDVSLTGISDGRVLAYNQISGQFEPVDPATGGGGTTICDIVFSLCETNYIVPENFVATGTTSCFTLSYDYHQYSSLVYVNSIWQRPGCDYTLSNCILNFAAQPDNGDEIYVRAFSRFDIPDGTITLNKLAQGTFVVDCYTGNGNDCVFLLSQDPGDVTHMQVAVGGLMQRPGAGYNLTYSNNNPYITFTAPPDNAVDIEVYLNRLVTPIFGITNDNLDLTYTSNQYTGNGSDTCYTIADGHTEDSVLVFLNGILMPPTEYDVIGTTLCFSSPPLSSQEIDIRYMPV